MLYFSIPYHVNPPTCIRRKSRLNFSKIINKLAYNLIFNTCANLINFIKKIIFSQSFLEQSRKDNTYFTRIRQLPFTFLILYLCNLTKSSYQPELNKFFKILTGSRVAKNVVSKVKREGSSLILTLLVLSDSPRRVKRRLAPPFQWLIAIHHRVCNDLISYI